MRVVISRDEGDTWEHRVVTDAFCPLAFYGIQRVAVDRRGNLYAVWEDNRDGLSYLSISRDGGSYLVPAYDGGRTGSQARPVSSERHGPGGGPHSHLLSGKSPPARLYQPAHTPDGKPYNAYLCECFNTLDLDPVFWSARVNDPSRPLIPRAKLCDAVGEGMHVTFLTVRRGRPSHGSSAPGSSKDWRSSTEPFPPIFMWGDSSTENERSDGFA